MAITGGPSSSTYAIDSLLALAAGLAFCPVTLQHHQQRCSRETYPQPCFGAIDFCSGRTSVGYAFPPHSKTKVQVFIKPHAQNENLDSGANAGHTARYAHLVLGEDKRLAVVPDTSVQVRRLQKIDSCAIPFTNKPAIF